MAKKEIARVEAMRLPPIDPRQFPAPVEAYAYGLMRGVVFHDQTLQYE